MASQKNMEENKNRCENCSCEKMNSCCSSKKCCSWNKCHLFRYLLLILILMMTFCLGSQFGELKSQARGYNIQRGGMMNWDYKVVKPFVNNQIPAAPETTAPELQ